MNKGFEFGLKWADNIGDFTYGAHVNLSKNKNEVIAWVMTRFIQSNPSVISNRTGLAC